jgi:glycosyltransferase involved in cell wall biosynthesis
VWAYALDLAAGLIAEGGAVMFAVMGPPMSAEQRAEASAIGANVQERPGALEWMEDPWTDVDSAGEWLLALERSWSPEVIHLNGYVHAALPWRAPILVVSHSCVCSWWRAVHGEPAPESWNEYRRRVRAGLRRARIVVAPSNAMRQALEAEYQITSAVAVIPNARRGGRAVSPSARPVFDDLQSAGQEGKAALVFTAARLWDDAKNVRALCAAAPELPWPVYVAGDIAMDGRVPEQLPNVRHLGRLDSGSMEGWLSRAAIYALPARYEPFGLSVLEAAMAGCALVLGDIPSLRENWEEAAVFVPPADTAAITRALREVIADTGARQALASRALARARCFSPERMTREYLQVYAQATAMVPA